MFSLRSLLLLSVLCFWSFFSHCSWWSVAVLLDSAFFLPFASLFLLRCPSGIFALRFKMWLRIHLRDVETLSKPAFSFLCAALNLFCSRTAAHYCSSKSSLRSGILSQCWDRWCWIVTSSICSLCSAILWRCCDNCYCAVSSSISYQCSIIFCRCCDSCCYTISSSICSMCSAILCRCADIPAVIFY